MDRRQKYLMATSVLQPSINGNGHETSISLAMVQRTDDKAERVIDKPSFLFHLYPISRPLHRFHLVSVLVEGFRLSSESSLTPNLSHLHPLQCHLYSSIGVSNCLDPALNLVPRRWLPCAMIRSSSSWETAGDPGHSPVYTTIAWSRTDSLSPPSSQQA